MLSSKQTIEIITTNQELPDLSFNVECICGLYFVLDINYVHTETTVRCPICGGIVKESGEALANTE